MVEYRIGCSGWSYQGWVGTFYPPGTVKNNFLTLYSKIFDTVEIDSTFYNVPSKAVIHKWYTSTPDDFLFCPKLPRQITHDNRLANVDLLLEMFMDRIRILGQKLGRILIQLPPSFSYENGFDSLREFIKLLPEDFYFAIEFRHNSWFRENIFSLLESKQMTLTWAETTYTKTPENLTTKDLYLRLVGDRSIREEDFGHLQKDRDSTISMWAKRIENRIDDIERVYVYSNNHFQGFAPGTANIFRRKLGLSELSFKDAIGTNNNQRTLF